MRVRALVVEKAGDLFHLQHVNLKNALPEDEVLVRIKATGVCHTDINFSNEESMPELYPGVLGHEGAGIVEKIGSNVTMVEEGDHVVVTYTSCGDCKYCNRKQTSYCDFWFKYNFGIGRLDGSKSLSSVETGEPITSHFFGQSSFADYIHVKETGLVKVPKDIPFTKLAPLGCGFMTGAGGAVGLAAIMSLKLLDRPPRKIIAVDIVPERLELARKYGATHGVNSKVRPNLWKVIMEITSGKGLDGSIDTTGKPEVIQDLVHSSARKGKIVSVGVDKANKEGKFPYDKLLTVYTPQEINKAVQDMLKGKTVKAVLSWD